MSQDTKRAGIVLGTFSGLGAAASYVLIKGKWPLMKAHPVIGGIMIVVSVINGLAAIRASQE